MKNLIMIAIALLTINATAQEQKKEVRKGEMKERMAVREAMTPEETATLKTKKMTLHLDLTAAQQVEVEKLMLVEAKERKTKMETFKAKNEGAEKPTKEERLKMQNARLDHQIEMKKKMKAILNADQFAKFDEMHSKRAGKNREINQKRKNK